MRRLIKRFIDKLPYVRGLRHRVNELEAYIIEHHGTIDFIPDRDFGMGVTLTGLKKRGYVPKVIYDIGAAEGAWARLALEVFPDSSIVCFEPLTERTKSLEQLVSDSREKVRFFNVGIGDADTELHLGVTEDLYSSSFAYGSTKRAVTVRTLESLHRTDNLELPSFVKIDVQGFEGRVINGGPSAFAHADMVLMECTFLPFCADMHTLDQTISFMSSKGFIPYEFVDFLRRPLDGAMGQCDILFIKRDHQLVSCLSWG